MGRLLESLLADSKLLPAANPANPANKSPRPALIFADSQDSQGSPPEIAAARPVVNFRLPDHAPSAWATCIGKPGETVAALVADLRERWPGVEVGP